MPLSKLAALLDISIHAPREGSDVTAKDREGVLAAFQSTLPARGATFLNCRPWGTP